MKRDPKKAFGNGVETICPLCGWPIHEGSQMNLRHGNWVHRSCMPGGDDE